MRHSTRNLLVFGFCGCLLQLSGCGGSSEPTSVASTDPAAANTAAEPPQATAESEPAPPPGDPGGGEDDLGGASSGEPPGDPSMGGGEAASGTEEAELAAGPGMDGAGEPGGAMDGFHEPGSEMEEELDPAGEMDGYIGPEADVGGGAMGFEEPGYGGSRRGGNGFIDQLASSLMKMVAPAVSQFATPDGASPESPKSFLERAAEAYQAGNEPLARKLYLAHLVGEFEEADQAFAETQFSNILKRPAWAIQWGASVQVRFSGDGEQKIHPVREEMPSPLGTAGNRRGAGRGNARRGNAGLGNEMEQGIGVGLEGSMEAEDAAMGMGSPRPGSVDGDLVASTVDLSEKLGLVAEVTSEMFGSRLESGAYGSAFAAYARDGASLPAADGAPTNGSEMARRQPGAALAEVSNATGEFAAGASAMPGSAMPGGSGAYEMEPSGADMGMEPAEMGPADGFDGMQPGSGMGSMNRRGGDAAAPPTTSVPAPELPRWRPGVVFIGDMNSAEALAKAQEHSLDFLIHFDVAVRTSQSGGAKNITRIRIYPVAASKPLVTSKAIDNIEIYKIAQSERKTERECVEEVVSSLFEILDQKMVMRPMPTLKREIAQERVISLIESANEDLLRTLAEIQLYHWQQAIDEEDVATAFHMAAGDDGLTILYGLPEAREELMETYVDASP